MLVYRIAKTKYIRDLSGTGAKMYGGRWNRVGSPLLYTSQHLSLSILELLVHFNSRSAIEQSFSYIALDIPDDLITSLVEKEDIQKIQTLEEGELWDLSDRYFKETNALALIVPSFVLPIESNVLIKPLHPEIDKITVHKSEKIALDHRLVI